MELREFYKELKAQLRQATDYPSDEAKMLIELVTKRSFNDIMFGKSFELTDDEVKELSMLASKRAQGYPLQYLFGKWSFMGRDYYIGEGVLIPRDDTEVLVRTALSLARSMPVHSIYDLCSGSGIIAVTLAKELSGADVTAVELTDTAFDYLKRNIKLNKAGNVTPLQGDIFKCFADVKDRSIDMLVSNPPYIAEDELKNLQKELLSEPKTALVGGVDGMDFYRAILKDWTVKVRHGGVVAFEADDTQAQDIIRLMHSAGLHNTHTVKDIQNLNRVVYGTVI